MPNYTVTDNTTGKKYRINAPEGTTRFQLQQYMQSQLGEDREEEESVVNAAAPTGLGGGVYNAARRGLSNLRGVPDSVMAEDLSRIADYEQDRAERDSRGELPLWERILTAQVKREDPVLLRSQAADAAQRRATRTRDAREAFPMTEAGEQAISDLAQSETFGEGLGKVARNPLATGLGLAEVAAEQAPSILAAAGVTALTRDPRLGAAAMAGSTYTQERYGQLLNDAAEAGYDLTKPADAQAAVRDQAFMASQAEKGRTRGMIIGTVDLLTAGLAAKTPFTLAGVGKNTGIQAVGGGGGEAAAQYASGEELQAGEILVEGLAEGVTAPVDIAALGLRTGGRFKEGPNHSQTNLKPELSQQLADEDAQLQAAALAQEEAVQQEQDALDDATYDLRVQAATTFTPKKKFDKERATARKTQQEADIANPETELGQAFKAHLKQRRMAGEPPLYDKADIAAEQTKFLKGYNDGRKDDIAAEDNAAYEQALDLHAEQVANGTVTPQVQPEEAQDTAEAAPKAPSVDPTTLPVRQRKDAIKQVEALVEDGSLPPNWAEQNDDLNGAINGQKFNIKKYKTALDKVLNPVEEAEAAPEVVPDTQDITTPPSANALLDSSQLRSDLKPQQMKVYDALLKAINEKATGNLITVEWKSGEKNNEERGWSVELDNQALAKLSGIENPSSAKTAVSGFNRAFKNAFSGEQVREALIQADALNTEAETLTAEEGQQFAAGLGGEGTLNTVGTAGGTQAEGASAKQSAAKKQADTKRFKAAGMTDEQIQAFFNTKDDVGTAEAELAGQVLEDIENAKFAVENADKLLRAQWAANSAPDGPSYDDLSMNNKIDWMETVYGTLGEANQSAVLAERANDLRGITDATTQDNESGRTEVQESSREEASAELPEDTGRGAEADAKPAESDGESFTAGEAKTAKVETKRKKKIAKPKIKYGLLSDIKEKLGRQLLNDTPEAKRQRFDRVLKNLTGKTGAYNIEVFDTFTDFAAARIRGDIEAGVETSKLENIPSDAYAFTVQDIQDRPVAFFFLDRIPAGRERAVFMHEVGGHVGIDEVLSVDERENIQTKIEKWAISREQKLENIIARRALQRVQNAKEAMRDGEFTDTIETAETIGYFLEEATFAGVEPSVTTALGRLVRDLYAAFKRALRKVGLQPDNLTPKDIVDLGWGAARLQLSARKHGTAQDFKRFDHSKMGSGEGAQVYGWGSYLAERFKIARWYMKMDIERKSDARRMNPLDFGIKPNEPIKFSNLPRELQDRIKNPPPSFTTVNKNLKLNLFNTPRPPRQLGLVGLANYGNGDEVIVSYIAGGNSIRAYPIDSLLTQADIDDGILQPQIDEIKAKLLKEEADFINAINVDGKLLFVDTTVANEELLKWSEPQEGQTADKITNLLQSFDPEDALLIAVAAIRNNYSVMQNTDILYRAEELLGLLDDDVTSDRLLGWGEFLGVFSVSRYEGFRFAEFLTAEQDLAALSEEDKAGLELFIEAANSPEIQQLVEETKSRINDMLQEVVDVVEGENLYSAMAMFDQRFDNALMPYLYEDVKNNKVFKYADGEWSKGGKFIKFDGEKPQLEHYLLHRSDKVVSMLLDQAGVKGVIYPDAGTRGAPINPEGMSNNVVIFNEDNLFIVASSPSGAVSRKKSTVSEIKFGRNADWVGHNFGVPAKNAYNTIESAVKTAQKSVTFLHDLISKNRKDMPAIGKWYDAILKAEAIRNEIRMGFEDIAVRARDLKPDRLELINDFLGKSTFFQKWGYDPKEYHSEVFAAKKDVKLDPIMKNAFGRLTEEEKALVADVFAHGEKMRQRKVAIAKKLGVSGKFFTGAALEGPYAPLKRFGNWVTELKSKELVAAETALDQADNKENRKAVEDLKSNPDHYIISFFDTAGSAKQFKEANESRFAFASSSPKEPGIEEGRISNPQVYEKVLSALKVGEDDRIDAAAKTAFEGMVKNLYFQSLDERDARMSGSRRLNRAGYEKNMMRSFLSHARSEASLISQMENGTDINAALAEARDQIKEGPAKLREEEKQAVYNMILHHYKDGMAEPTGIMRTLTGVSDRLAAANSVYMLTSSVGYHLTNATQPAMVTIPRIAGDFNNYTGAWNALFKGYRIASAAVGMQSNLQTNISLDKVPSEYQKMLENLQLRQLLDVGMDEDLAEFDRINTGFEPLNKTADFLGKVTHKLYQVARFVEAVNRISAAVAAFDVATKNPKQLAQLKMTPQEYATSVVEDTQGNFSRLDAPLLIKVAPKLTVQYRKYQLLMAWHYSKAFKQTFKGETPETKAIGRRTLGYSIAHAALGAGATGIPLLSTAFWLTTFIGDEDEPDDLERFIKRHVDDDKLATALSRGVFSSFGVDLSTKLNQAKIFHPLPYVDYQTGESGAKDIFFNALAGPSGTTAVNFYRAHEYLTQGDTMKGIEYMVPKGIRSAMESYRLATEGYTMRNGDVVVDPRELDTASLLLNGLGIPATEIQEVKWTRGQQYELEQYFSKESGKLRKAYIKANKARDRQEMKNLREEWRELQEAKKRVRPFFNNARGVLERQPVSDLLKAPREQRKREKKARQKISGN